MNNAVRLALVAYPMSLLVFSAYSMASTDQPPLRKVLALVKKMSPLQSHGYIGRLRKEDYNDVSSIIDSGRRLDRSQVAHIISMLNSPPHISYVEAGLHALARMGAVQGLPIVQTYIDTDSGDLERYAVVVKARLLAESASPTTNDALVDSRQESMIKVKRFYEELHMTPLDLNEALTAFQTPNITIGEDGKTYHHFSTLPPSPSVGVYAMRELADIVYNGSFNNYASLPEIAGVNFQKDYPAALKMRLAAVPHNERLRVIIDELANKKALTPNDYYEFQLAINEGKPASRLAAQKLLQMEAQHDQYASAGFNALFSIISGVGDQQQSAVLARFLHVTYLNVDYYAEQNYRDLIDGNRGEYIVNY